MSSRAHASNRECRCDVDLICRFVRVLAAITVLGIGVAAGFVAAIGATFYNSTGPTAFCSFVENRRLGIFLCIIGIFFVAFSIIGFLGELRFEVLRRTVLKPFGILLSYVGRGLLYMLLGTLFCALPMEKSNEIITLVPGGVLVGVGIIELSLGILVKKDRSATTTTTITTRQQSVAGAATPKSSEANKIKWGEPEAANSSSDVEAGSYTSSSSFSSAGGIADATPSKKALVSSSSPATPRTPTAAAAGRQSVVTANPFRNASGKAV